MIFADTNVLSESTRQRPEQKVLDWVRKNDQHLAVSTVALAEIKFGIERIRPQERARALDGYFAEMRQHFAGRIFAFDEESAVIYGEIMGEASRKGYPSSVPDAMIAAVALRHKSALATRNVANFRFPELIVINPWA